MIKKIKIFIDICMVALLILLFPALKINPSFHVIFGFILIPLIITHILLNGKWMLGSLKNLFRGKLNKKILYMFINAIMLIIAFSICIFTSIIVYQSEYYPSYRYRYMGGIDSSIMFLYRLHGISGIISIVLTIFHIKINLEYIKSFFNKENKKI
jgi:hypothetical protein